MSLSARAKPRLTVEAARLAAGSCGSKHAVALMLALNQRINCAFSRMRKGNFELDGMIGHLSLPAKIPSRVT